MPKRTSKGPGCVVFLHAHPDDEAIFTGGTIRLLANNGIRSVVIFATAGERGIAPCGSSLEHVASIRTGEIETAAHQLGVSRIVHLGFEDSGMPGDNLGSTSGTLAAAPISQVADAVAQVLADEQASCLISYDANGIYGHPDHVVVHRAGMLATQAAAVSTRYEATVDREYLHFVETHLVEEARRSSLLASDPAMSGLDSLDLRHVGIPDETIVQPQLSGHDVLQPNGYGTPTVLIDVAVDVSTTISAKRAAMACHTSQIPPESSPFRLGPAAFRNVYGTEWYLRTGPRGVLDGLPSR